MFWLYIDLSFLIMVELLLFLLGLFFSFVNEHLDEPVEMLSFPPSIFGSRFWLYLQQHCVSQLRYWFIFFYSNPF